MFVLWTFRDIERRTLLGPFTDADHRKAFIAQHFNGLMAEELEESGAVYGASLAYKLEKIEPTLSVTG